LVVGENPIQKRRPRPLIAQQPFLSEAPRTIRQRPKVADALPKV